MPRKRLRTHKNAPVAPFLGNFHAEKGREGQNLWKLTKEPEKTPGLTPEEAKRTARAFLANAFPEEQFGSKVAVMLASPEELCRLLRDAASLCETLISAMGEGTTDKKQLEK